MTVKRIGLLSDTHGFLHPGVSDFFSSCDEIWHAGDIGSMEVVARLRELKPLRAVYGNIDGISLRQEFSEVEIFHCEQVKVLMIHIGGYPGRYSPQARKLIEEHQPRIFISGHSHILKVIPDRKYDLLHINPGAAGNSGLHKSITMIRFTIDKDNISDLEVYDQPRNLRIQ